jgi:hypothetical protein
MLGGVLQRTDCGTAAKTGIRACGQRLWQHFRMGQHEPSARDRRRLPNGQHTCIQDSGESGSIEERVSMTSKPVEGCGENLVRPCFTNTSMRLVPNHRMMDE